MNNVALIQCECGSTSFELIKVVEVTKFFEKEYKGAFIERIPTFFSEQYKLRCHNCGVLFNEKQ